LADAALLQVRGLLAGYGHARVLHGIDFVLEPGRTLVIIGRNGVGKTTLVETLMGLTTLHGGEIDFAGQRVEQLPAHRRNRLGIGWVPQSREIFPSLTVEENLRVVARPGPWSVERVCTLFPRLAERRRHHGDELSGGEQQMLAMARALITNPRLLLLDEPVEGLAPLIVQEMFSAIDAMRRSGDMALIVVEQKHELALAHGDDCIVIDHGTVVHRATCTSMQGDAALLDRLLGVAA
jgi:branched-chain amino acid transport system ATP-binding protein